ncbi:MAG TPA: hypothetical protein VGO40_13115 [Longimicrobium sp.]|jgi:hypothetical protein|nr:hypothetical protein [Longimicrobium sp.]
MDLLALGIAGLALVVSGATFYYQIGRAALLSLVPGKNVALTYDSKNRLLFVVGVTFVNRGAKTGIIVGLSGSINPPGAGMRSSHAWHAIADSSASGTASIGFSPQRTVDAWLRTVIVPGMGATVHRIVFRTQNPVMLVPGSYEITIVADCGPPKHFGPTVSIPLVLTENDVVGMEKKRPDADEYDLWFVRATEQLRLSSGS